MLLLSSKDMSFQGRNLEAYVCLLNILLAASMAADQPEFVPGFGTVRPGVGRMEPGCSPEAAAMRRSEDFP